MIHLTLLLALLCPRPTGTTDGACPMRVEVRDASGAVLPAQRSSTLRAATLVAVTDADGAACVTPARAVRVERAGLPAGRCASGQRGRCRRRSHLPSRPTSKWRPNGATRGCATRRCAPRWSSREFVEQIGARTLADAVEYTTGVRVENNCQNCNFSQVRLLGLEGPYTQILMDGQPTLSSLAQVYGLEQIPARLIDRIEVTKGGGAALLGPGSVGGVINVITREPTTRGAQLDTDDRHGRR